MEGDLLCEFYYVNLRSLDFEFRCVESITLWWRLRNLARYKVGEEEHERYQVVSAGDPQVVDTAGAGEGQVAGLLLLALFDVGLVALFVRVEVLACHAEVYEFELALALLPVVAYEDVVRLQVRVDVAYAVDLLKEGHELNSDLVDFLDGESLVLLPVIIVKLQAESIGEEAIKSLVAYLVEADREAVEASFLELDQDAPLVLEDFLLLEQLHDAGLVVVAAFKDLALASF